MGCINSKPHDQSKVVELKTTNAYEDFNPKARYLLSEDLIIQPTFNIVSQDAGLPKYELPSVDTILKTLQLANGLKLYGIPGAFSICNERHFEVYIDSSFQLKANTRNAILLMALFTLLVGKSTDCDMTFYFTSYPNKKSKSLSDDGRECLTSLEMLWMTRSWEEAVVLIKHTHVLRDSLKIQDWLDDEENFIKGETEDEKHTKLLSLARQKMLQYWYGWHQRDLTIQKLIEYHRLAINAARKQPKSLNSVRFTYERSINHYLRLLKNAKTAEAYPVTNIFVLGSAMQPTEIAAIKNCQESEGSEIKKAGVKKKQQKEVVEGQGTQFQISAVVMTENMSDVAVNGYRKIDNFAEGEDDINDLTTLNESRVLRNFLSPKAIFKINNCHNPEVDNLKISSDELYSNMVLTHNTTITMPAVTQAMKILGIENVLADDSDEDGTPHRLMPTSVTITASRDDDNHHTDK